MEYLFLRRKKTRYTSVRQKTLLYRAASRRWEKEFALRTDVRRIDALIYKGILYLMEVRQVFLDSSLSLKTLSAMLETNQTYLSNVVNRYFGCNLKELVNTYRVEYAKELLRSGRCPIIACFNLQCIISGREIRETYLMLIAYKLPFFIDAFQLHGILRFIFVLIIKP